MTRSAYTPAARLALAELVGAGVRLSAGEVAQLLADCPRLRRLARDELNRAREQELVAAAARLARRARADLGPELPFVAPMVRSTDPAPSAAAAAAILPDLSAIQSHVVEVYRRHGELSARQAERLLELADYGFSTVRKRISELAAAGVLVSRGVETEGGPTPATVYGLSVAMPAQPAPRRYPALTAEQLDELTLHVHGKPTTGAP